MADQNTTVTHGISEFLLARLDETEAAATEWRERVVMDAERPDAIGAWIHNVAAHTIATCEAHRRIIDWHGERDDCCEERHGPVVLTPDGPVTASRTSSGPVVRQEIGSQAYLGCVTLMMMAAVYADHPDYQGSWSL